MAAYTQNELDKVNKVLEQIALIKQMIKSIEADNSQDAEMNSDVEEDDVMN